MKKIFLLLLLAILPATSGKAIDIIWDYTYDTDGFFSSQERQNILNLVNAELSHLQIDSPDIIYTPNAGNHWDWDISDPGNMDTNITIENKQLSAGTLTIYLGAYNIGDSVLGRGGPSGWDISYTDPSWGDLVFDLDTEDAFQPFAGSLALSTDVSWYDGTNADVPGGEMDMFSVVLHEVGHILGIGTGGFAWAKNTLTWDFEGANAVALYEGAVPISDDGGHLDDVIWNGVQSVMNPTLPAGTRLYWTDLETAMLKDLGYIVIPEPNSLLLILSSGVFFLLVRRRTCFSK